MNLNRKKYNCPECETRRLENKPGRTKCRGCKNKAAMESYRRCNPDKKKRRPVKIQILHYRWALLKRKAGMRKLEFALTFENYVELVQDKGCSYCGEALPKTGGGLDRLDNSIGYIINNVIPCCYSCNTIRGANLTVEEMRAVANFIRELRNDKN